MSMNKVIRLMGLCVGLVVVLALGCERQESAAPGSGGAKTGSPPADVVELLFTYGSEKQIWLEDVTSDFNGQNVTIGSGKVVRVKPVAMGSGECIDELLAGRTQAHLTSPASGAFVVLGNAQSRTTTGQDLIPKSENLVLSPVVIAMWKPMAEALGWPGKTIGWADVLSLSTDKAGWASRGRPEWGAFKFGHTHPEYSNSGLISVLAQVYAATGKTTGLTRDDVNKPETARYVGDIQRSIVHYGSSTGFFGRKMFDNGPGYLSAAVLYENMVIESYTKQPPTQLPVVAIYPKEGTFWSDHPVGVVNRPWVTDDHKEAAAKYIAFLLDKAQQEKALKYGFRPADPSITLGETFSPAFGVDAKEPKTTLDVPSAEVMDAAIELWRGNKKHANVVLVFDTSGSMNEENRMPSARAGAAEMIKLLGDEDTLTLVPFSSQTLFAGSSVSMKTGRDQMLGTVNGLIAGGGTRLYNSIAEAYDYLEKNPQPGRISAIVVLTDGADTAKQMKLEELIEKVKYDSEQSAIRIFTIGYGAGAEESKLKQISEQTQAKFYKGKPEDIRAVFKDIATFF